MDWNEPLAQVRSSLLAVNALWRTVDTKWTILGLSLYSANLVPEIKQISFLAHFIVTFIAGFGGGTLTAVLIMNPEKVPLGILTSNYLGLCWVASWWAMNYSPYNIPSRLFKFRPVKAIARACVAYNRANQIMSKVDIASELFPGVALAPIVVGTMSGCASKFCFDLICQYYGVNKEPHEASAPTLSWRSVFLGTVFYYVTAVFPSPLRFLHREEASAIFFSVFVFHSLLSELTGLKLDWTEPIMNMLLTLCNIPVPGYPPQLQGVESSIPPQDPSSHKPVASSKQEHEGRSSPDGCVDLISGSDQLKDKANASGQCAADGKRSIQSLPGANGKGSIRNLPAANGKGSIRNLLITNGNGAVQSLPAANGKVGASRVKTEPGQFAQGAMLQAQEMQDSAASGKMVKAGKEVATGTGTAGRGGQSCQSKKMVARSLGGPQGQRAHDGRAADLLTSTY